jgi:hypothetical protein
MTVRAHFGSLAGMEQVHATGAEEGMCTVFSQLETVLAGMPVSKR